jgi:hypothetical protein
MGNRMLMVMAAAVAIVAIGGIGFATLTSSITANVSGTAGGINVDWVYPGIITSPLEVATGAAVCNSGGTDGITDSGTLLTISASNLGPGDYCTISDVVVENTQGLPGTLSEGFSSVVGCSDVSYSDNLPGASIGGYGQVAYVGQLGPYTGSTPGQACTFTITVTATAT